MDGVKTILIVDDHVDFVRMLELHLRTHGYRVLTAYDGASGLKIAEEQRPDLITLDVTMPKKDGFEFYKEILTRHGHKKFPILIVTAREDLADTFHQIEADGFISKPFEIGDLLKEVSRILERKSSAHIFLMDLRENPHAFGIAKALEEEFYRVSLVENLEEFQALAERTKPDFVVMEYIQECLSGEICIGKIRELLSKTDHPDQLMWQTPLVVYTYSDMDYEAKAIKAGADRYLKRPASYDEIVTAVRDFEIKKQEQVRTRTHPNDA